MAAFFALLPRTTAQAAELAEGHDEQVSGERVLAATDADRPLRHALEFRSSTFATSAAYALLREHDVGCVLADTAGRWPRVEESTSDFRYLRLHGDRELYTSGYSTEALDGWADRCRSWAQDQDVFVYFDNDAKDFAPCDAMGLISRLGGG